MKAKNVKVGVGVVIKDCAVGYARPHIGKRGVIDKIVGDNTYRVDIGGSYVLVYNAEIRKMKSSDLDEAPITYTHPMQEHLGREVEVVVGDDSIKLGMRGFVVSFMVGSKTRLLIDFGDGFAGHSGRTSGHPQKTETCWFVGVDNLKFLTEDE